MAVPPRSESPSARVRERLGHPVLDGDAHFLEDFPDFMEFVNRRGRGELLGELAPFSASPMGRGPAWNAVDAATREHHRLVRPPWWVATGETRDFATAILPRLYYERLDDIGVDYAVMYPTGGLGMTHMDGTARPELCRLFNEWTAERFGPFADRMTPAALVPMNTPQEGIEALEHAHGLGLKVALIPTYVARAVPALAQRAPELAAATWIDTYGIDSLHDYDPFWRRAIELGLPLACHSNGMGFTDRASISNYMYNHIGHFAAAGEALAKSLFLGGVTFRFPRLRVALLEGGASHGIRLYHDLVHRWKKRGGKNVSWLDPAGLDREQLGELFAAYGDGIDDARLEAISRMFGSSDQEPADEFGACAIEGVADIRDHFIPCFCWGCEADDPLVAWAFEGRLNPLGAKLPAIMGSDVGHWDVRDFTEPLAEAHELVDDGVLDADQFREFVFDNPVRFYAANRPDFFDGTRVEAEARRVLAAGSGAATAASP